MINHVTVRDSFFCQESKRWFYILFLLIDILQLFSIEKLIFWSDFHRGRLSDLSWCNVFLIIIFTLEVLYLVSDTVSFVMCIKKHLFDFSQLFFVLMLNRIFVGSESWIKNFFRIEDSCVAFLVLHLLIEDCEVGLSSLTHPWIYLNQFNLSLHLLLLLSLSCWFGCLCSFTVLWLSSLAKVWFRLFQVLCRLIFLRRAHCSQL